MTDAVDRIVLVLKEWSGTPEELGAALHDATMDLPQRGLYSDAFVQECRARQQDARERILACNGGKELLEEEWRSLRGL